MKQSFTRLLLFAAGLLLEVPAVQAQVVQTVPAHRAQLPVPRVPQELAAFKELAGRRALPGNAPAEGRRRRPLARPDAGQATRTTKTTDQARSAETAREAWVARYRALGLITNEVSDMTVDAAGNTYVTGASRDNDAFPRGFATVKYSPSGQVLWEARYSSAIRIGSSRNYDQANAIAVDAAGNVYVTGSNGFFDASQVVGQSDIVTVKYSPSGQQLWISRYDGPGEATRAYDAPIDLVVDGTDNVYVTGISSFNPLNDPRTSFNNFVTIKYDGGNGQQFWSTLNGIPGRNQDAPEDMALDAVGDVYVTGNNRGSIVTRKYAGATGALVWATTYTNIVPFSISRVAALAVDAAGNVLITGNVLIAGNTSSNSITDYLTLKYAGTSGQQLWEVRYNGPDNSNDQASDVAVDAVGNVYVTGYSRGLTSNYDYATLKYSADGQQQWATRYNGPSNANAPANDLATHLAVDATGNVYVTGNSDSSGSGSSYDYTTLKYSPSGQELWVARYNGPDNYDDRVAALALDQTGSVVVAGTSVTVPRSSSMLTSGSDYATIKYTQSDVPPLWEARFTGAGPTDEVATDVVTDAAGNVYVSGYAYNGSNYDYATVKYNTAGQQLWQARYNGPANGDEVPTALAVDAAGNVVVTGYSLGSGSSYDYATVKYSASGQELWSARYSGLGQGNKYAFALALDAAGNVFVTGEAAGIDASPRGSIEYLTLKYSASGQQLWTQRYSGFPFSTSGATAITVDAAGNAYVTGYSFSPSSLDYATLKYSASGQQQWVARYAGPQPGPFSKNDIATALAVDAAGNVYVTGSSENERDASNYDYATLKYSPSGQELWAARYNGSANSHDLSAGLALDAAGNVYVTGTSYKGSSWDYTTLKYSTTTGQQLWQTHYDGPASSYDEATALALDAAGNAYVTGFSYNSDGTDDYATIKYASSSGQQLWQARYNGPGNSYDEAAALAVDGAGNVYVTGFSLGNGTGYDYATLKYAPPGNLVRASDMAVPLASAGRILAASTKSFQQLAVYPNPATGPTTVSFRPVQEGAAQVLVYNQLGQQVATLYEGAVRKGQHYELPLHGEKLAPGLYTCALLVNGQRETVRLFVTY